MAEDETIEGWYARKERELIENPILAHIKQLRSFAEQARKQAASYDHEADLMQEQYDFLVHQSETSDGRS